MKDPINLTPEEQEHLAELKTHISQLLEYSSTAVAQHLFAIEQQTGQKMHYCVFLFNGKDDGSRHRCVATDVDEVTLSELFREQAERIEQQKDLIRDLKRLNHEGSTAVH